MNPVEQVAGAAGGDLKKINHVRALMAALERGDKPVWRALDDADVVVSVAPPEMETDAAGRRAPTGFAALDEALQGGLHLAALNEVFMATAGSGGHEALLPALCRAGSGHRLLVWIHPERMPHPPALAQTGLPLDRWLFVRSGTTDNHHWALDQVLRSGACDAVVAHLEDVPDRGLRRLQLAAEQGDTLALLFRPAVLVTRPSPAAVRLWAEPAPAVHPARRRVAIDVLRCRGTALTRRVMLEMSRDALDEPAASWVVNRAGAEGDAAGGHHRRGAVGAARRA